MGAAGDTSGVSLIRDTPSGPVQGVLSGSVERFLGIPYASAPVGEQRFAVPILPASWRTPFSATKHGPTSAQAPYPGTLGKLLPTRIISGEQSLNLNIFAPAMNGSALRPVLLWIHGGSLQHGSNALPGYDGSNFARDGVIFVAVNYRLGAEGFSVLKDAPLNLGLADVMAALEWVKANIASFGGDHRRVTLMGHSAGGSLVAALLAHPRAVSLVSRAIIQSAPLAAQPVKRAGEITRKIAAELGIAATRDGFCSRSPAELLRAQSKVAPGSTPLEGGPSYSVAIKAPFVPADPFQALLAGAAKEIPLLMGTTTAEARLWLAHSGYDAKPTGIQLGLLHRKAGVPRDAHKLFARNRPAESSAEVLGALVTDMLLRVPMYKLADARHYAQASTHVYEFAWPSPVSGLGAAHGTELPFVFDNLDAEDAIALVGDTAPHSLASAMHEIWVCFATRGVADWPAWDLRRPVKTFDGKKNPVVLSPREDEAAALD